MTPPALLRKLGKDLLTVAIEHTDRSHWMRARNAIFAALVLDPMLLGDLDRQGVLIDYSMGRRRIQKLLALLARESPSDLDSLHPDLAKRIDTYRNAAELADRYRKEFSQYAGYLRGSRRLAVKFSLGLADLSFFGPRLPQDAQNMVTGFLQTLEGCPDTPEDCAEIASRIIAEAGEVKTLNSAELSAPVAHGFVDDDTRMCLNAASIRCKLWDYYKRIQILGYRLSHLRVGKRDVFLLEPPRDDIERANHLGHSARELSGGGASFSFDSSGIRVPTYQVAAGIVASHWASRFCHVIESPFPRVRVELPLIPRLYQHLHSLPFAEDFIYQRTALDELVIGNDEFFNTRLSPRLTLGHFLRLYRAFRLFGHLHTESVMAVAGGRFDVIANSCIPVMERSNLIELLRQLGDSTELIEEFLDLISWDSADREFLDLQYSPLVSTGGDFLFSPRIVTRSNDVRNVMLKTSIRPTDVGDAFTDKISSLLKQRFSFVVSKQEFDINDQEGDIDVGVLSGNTLFVLAGC